jgi:hypothetical protein
MQARQSRCLPHPDASRQRCTSRVRSRRCHVGRPTDVKGVDDMLAAGVPDGSPEGRPLVEAHDSDQGGALGLVGDEDIDRIDPAVHGSTSGQIDRAPEDGDPFFDVTQ